MEKRKLSLLAAGLAAVFGFNTDLSACMPHFPPSFMDQEDAKFSQYSERELAYHMHLLYEKFLSADCVPPSPRSAEKDPADSRKEYDLYAAGVQEITDDPKCSFPENWKKLLALPAAERRYRTVRTYYMLGNLAMRNDQDNKAAYGFYQKLRQAVLDGYPDNLGLSLDSFKAQYRYGSGKDRIRFLVMAVRYGVLNGSIRDSLRHDLYEFRTNPERKAELLKDPLLAEVLLLSGAKNVSGVNLKFLLADRLAMRAFEAGNMVLCRQLLDQTPDNSLIKLYLLARLARRDGNFDLSADYLRKWLKLYRENNQTVPEMKFNRETFHGPEPFTWKQEVNGILGLVSIDLKDFQEALYAFLCADAWSDAALIAEQYLTTEELEQTVDAVCKNSTFRHSADIRCLLARRLLREEQYDKVHVYSFAFVPFELVKEYIASRKAAVNPDLPEEERAKHYFRAGQIVLRHGMNLLGYELAPDYCIIDGAFASHPPYNEKMRKDPALPRFHYRAVIAECFTKAAELTNDPDLKFAAYLAPGWSYRNREPEKAEVFYHAIVKMTGYPMSTVMDKLRWLPALEQEWRDRFLNEIDPFKPETVKRYTERIGTHFKRILAKREAAAAEKAKSAAPE